jgi:hypothetical protein
MAHHPKIELTTESYFLLFIPHEKYAVRLNVYLLSVWLLADGFAYIITMHQQY